MDIISYIMLAGIVVGLCTLWGIIFILCWALIFPTGQVNNWLFGDSPKGGNAGTTGITAGAAASVIVTSSFTR